MGRMERMADPELERRLAALERSVDVNRAEVDSLRQRANRADDRADQGDARFTAQDARMDTMEAQSGLDRKVIAQLQAEGLVGDEHAAHLQAALSTSRRIGAAIGMVMLTRQVDEVEAFELLCAASQHSNRKLRALTEEIVSKGDLSGILEP